MNHHHTAIILLGGWILMVPPVDGGQLPLSEWHHAESHDTAADCQRAIAKNLAFAESMRAEMVAGLWRLARCVPAEHIYPPKTE
jgi:hypothetical protein